MARQLPAAELAALRDALARVVRAVDALADGDTGLACEILRDLEFDLERDLAPAGLGEAA